MAQDLPGAFAEWEAQAHALTKCKNYLYSLSINPDERQGQLTREQYMDFIERTEDKLGLNGQPRAVVFHIKDGREHAHVVWSRVDVYNEKAIHMAFDKDKLMMVTREFARDHDLTLPDGYFKKDGEKTAQLSLYELEQQRETGLSKKDHIHAVTDAWRSADNAQAFVQALAEKGYMLATGRRPYVLVDFYGGQYALPRMIDDKTVRAKDVQRFLEKDYPPDSLPSVEEAKALIAVHRKSSEAHLKNERRSEALAQLKRKQKSRRAELETEKTALRQEQHKERQALSQKHKTARDNLKKAHLAKTKWIKSERYKNRPKGLADFLGKLSGINALRKQIYRYQDRQRTKEFIKKLTVLKEKQRDESLALQRTQEMRGLDLQRKISGLERIESKEKASVEQNLRREVRFHARGGRCADARTRACPDTTGTQGRTAQGETSPLPSTHRQK